MELVDKVVQEHLLRLDRCETLPLKRRKAVRKEANTSIIAEAAKRVIADREWAEGIEISSPSVHI
jgi:hypothetical protein